MPALSADLPSDAKDGVKLAKCPAKGGSYPATAARGVSALRNPCLENLDGELGSARVADSTSETKGNRRYDKGSSCRLA